MKSEFDAVVSAAHRKLKPRGYLKSGARFRRVVSGNSIIIGFQKSAWGAHDNISLTVNLAILSHTLGSWSGADPSKIFDASQGHVRIRIGQFHARPGDHWWSLNRPGSAEAVSAELLPLLERGVDYCEAHASDDELASLWRRANDPARQGKERSFSLSADLQTLVDARPV